MRKSIAVSVFLLLILVQCVFPVLGTAAETPAAEHGEKDASVTLGCNTLDGKAPVLGLQQIVPNMTAAFLYDVNQDIVLYALNPDAPMYPASFVKIMTAFIAVEKGNLTDIVSVKESVLSTLPKSAANVRLEPNEQISLSDLLYCMMVGSGNDAAAVIADHVSGSQEKFVEEMNKKAAEIGCTGTVFTNPHGLMQEGQTTTARDVARIIYYAMQNESFMTYFGEEYYIVPETNKHDSRELCSNNYLMYSVDNMRIYRDYRTTGGRTGLDSAERRCVAATAEDNGRTLISVLFGAESVVDEEKKTTITFGGFTETTQLLNIGFEDLKPFQVMYIGEIFRQYPVLGGENEVVAGSAEEAFSILPVSADGTSLSYRFYDEKDAFTAPIEIGQKLTTLQIWYGNVCVAETDLFAMSSVRPVVHDDEQKRDNRTNMGIWKDALVVIAVVAVGLVVLLLCIRCIGLIRYSLIKKRRRRYGRSRRRSR